MVETLNGRTTAPPRPLAPLSPVLQSSLLCGDNSITLQLQLSSSSSQVPAPLELYKYDHYCTKAQHLHLDTGAHTRQDPHNFGNWKHVIPIRRTMEATRETVIIGSLSLHYETRAWPWSSLGHTRSICRGGFSI